MRQQMAPQRLYLGTCVGPHIILRVFVKPRKSGKFFTWLSLDAVERAVLALLLFVCPIYSYLHVGR